MFLLARNVEEREIQESGRIVDKPEVGLASAKTLLESDAPSSDERSDMMNEAPAPPMPALIPTGPEKMLEQVKDNRLLVPLRSYRIHVQGTSTRGLTPEAWSTIKSFWTKYWRAAGAESVSYSEEASLER